MSSQEETALSNYKEQLAAFEKEEAKAHERWKKEEEMGMTDGSFYDWLNKMMAPAASVAHQSLQAAAAQLQQVWSQNPENAQRSGYMYDPWVKLPGRQDYRTYDEESEESIEDAKKKGFTGGWKKWQLDNKNKELNL